MLSNRDASPLESQGEMPQLDEGWWESVLSEEIHVPKHYEEIPQQSHQNQGAVEVDWKNVQKIYDQDEVVELEVNGFNRGGLLVQGTGVQGFVPISHLVGLCDIEDEQSRKDRLSEYVGTKLHLKVIECQPALERIVLSERAALAGDGSRKHLFKTLKVGEQSVGTVTNVTDFGVFVDLGGVEGLIHVSELSWGRVQHPNEILNVGEQVETIILQVCEESSRVALSLKRRFPNPWETLAKKYSIGDIVEAKITSIMRFGAFARLEDGVEGLIHVSSIELDSGNTAINDLLTVGQGVNVEILHIDINRRRLGLGLV